MDLMKPEILKKEKQKSLNLYNYGKSNSNTSCPSCFRIYIVYLSAFLIAGAVCI